MTAMELNPDPLVKFADAISISHPEYRPAAAVACDDDPHAFSLALAEIEREVRPDECDDDYWDDEDDDFDGYDDDYEDDYDEEDDEDDFAY